MIKSNKVEVYDAVDGPKAGKSIWVCFYEITSSSQAQHLLFCVHGFSLWGVKSQQMVSNFKPSFPTAQTGSTFVVVSSDKGRYLIRTSVNELTSFRVNR